MTLRSRIRRGMDIDCCKNVQVANCTVNSPWDDGICPKSSYALGYSRATENVNITNCVETGYYELGTVLDGAHKQFAPDARGVGRTGRIKCGTESNGGFKNITISNCVLEGCNGLALESEDGAVCEDIAISNITCRNLTNGLLFFRLGSRLRGPVETTRVGTLKRILVTNIVSSNSAGRLPNILSGIPGYPLEDIKISNFYMQQQGGLGADAAAIVPPERENAYPDPGMFGGMPAQGFYLRHIRNLEMSHVEVASIAPDARPAFVLEGVERGDFFAITAPGVKLAFAFHHSKDLRIASSRAAADLVLEEADSRTA
jgi:polygalacturonase